MEYSNDVRLLFDDLRKKLLLMFPNMQDYRYKDDSSVCHELGLRLEEAELEALMCGIRKSAREDKEILQ